MNVTRYVLAAAAPLARKADVAAAGLAVTMAERALARHPQEPEIAVLTARAALQHLYEEQAS